MQSHLLKAGTLLDDRYRILSVLGQGGFGITYAAENLRIGLRVAIKELYWRGYSVRNAEVSPRVEIADEQHAPMFHAHKDSFLREARIIRDFSGMPGVAHILDYFEANDTAYIVMEYVEGETLAAYLRRQTRIPAGELFARFLPLAESLGKIHAAGVIHRDISPDNIMVQPDGSLTLIDFGAARVYRTTGEINYTTIAKESFAPGEQYDKNGRQGPWTDVYALCATMYACITGFPPLSSVQRMFLDELKKPSELGLEIDPAFEAILMKGLEMTAANRHANMEDFALAVRAALPRPKEGRSRTHSALFGMVAGLLCAALVLALWALHERRTANPFRGVDTETFCLIAPEDMTASAFAQVQTDFAARLEAFAGKGNYILKTEGDRLHATLPLETFGGQEIYSVLKAEFMPLVEGKRYNMEYELKADWENPAASITPGKNQVLPDALEGKTAMLSYGWDSDLSLGQRANLLMDFKVRLDALDTPYAFGTLYGDANTLVIRIRPERLNQFVLDSLGDDGAVLHIAGDYDVRSYPFSHSSYSRFPEVQAVQYDDGSFGIRCSLMYDHQKDSFGALTEELLSLGEDTLYLQSSGGYALAELLIAEAADPEAIEFRNFRFENASIPNEEYRWAVEYVDALINRTALPVSCSLKEARLLDEDGTTLLDEPVPYGMWLREKPCNEALWECLKQFIQDNGFSGRAGDNDIQIRLNLDVDENLVHDFTAAVEMLLNDYGLKDMVINYYLEIVGIDEQPGESYSITMDTDWSFDQSRWINDMDCWISTDGRLAPYVGEFAEWWESLSEETIGVTTD